MESRIEIKKSVVSVKSVVKKSCTNKWAHLINYQSINRHD